MVDGNDFGDFVNEHGGDPYGLTKTQGETMVGKTKSDLKCPACKTEVERLDGYCPECNHPLKVSGDCTTKLCLACKRDPLTPEKGGRGRLPRMQELLDGSGAPDECLICDVQDEFTCMDCPVTQY